MRVVDVDRTRSDIRRQMAMWDIDPSEFEILWDEERDRAGRITRLPGVKLRYMRNSQWQEIACHGFTNRAENLRQVFFLVERLRIAEQHGVQYQGLSYTKEVATTGTETQRKQDLLDAYDILGVAPDDPVELIERVYRQKVQFYHPDMKGGDEDKFKRLQGAYEIIKKNRRQK